MKADDYVKVLEAVKDLENESYFDFDLLWKKLYKNKSKTQALTEEEYEVMEFFIRAMQDLGYIRGVLEEIREEKLKR